MKMLQKIFAEILLNHGIYEETLRRFITRYEEVIEDSKITEEIVDQNTGNSKTIELFMTKESYIMPYSLPEDTEDSQDIRELLRNLKDAIDDFMCKMYAECSIINVFSRVEIDDLSIKMIYSNLNKIINNFKFHQLMYDSIINVLLKFKVYLKNESFIHHVERNKNEYKNFIESCRKFIDAVPSHLDELLIGDISFFERDFEGFNQLNEFNKLGEFNQFLKIIKP